MTGTGLFWVWPLLTLIGLLLVGWGGWRLAQGQVVGRRKATSSARRILDERCARGEIDETEYRRRRAELP